jgi:hypothetical protein
MAIEIVAAVAGGLFAGVALGITVAEHPARMTIGAQEARKQFKGSYKRIAPFQVHLRPFYLLITSRIARRTPCVSGLVIQCASYYKPCCVQVVFALVCSGACLYLALKGGSYSSVYLAAGLSMLAIVPYTLVFIFPTNKKLLSPDKLDNLEVCSLPISSTVCSSYH